MKTDRELGAGQALRTDSAVSTAENGDFLGNARDGRGGAASLLRLSFHRAGQAMSEVGPELLGRLLDEHGAALVLYARCWCEAPEDVVQEALLKLVEQPARPENVVAWLYRVVRNGAISAGRSERRRREREAAAARLRPSAFNEAGGNAIDVTALAAALEQLPHDQREAIVAHLWGGLSFEEVAVLASCSSSTAHRRYVAGLTTLRERLGVACPKNTSSNG